MKNRKHEWFSEQQIKESVETTIWMFIILTILGLLAFVVIIASGLG